MTVLIIIGILVGLVLLSWFVEKANALTKKLHKYEIFNKESYFTSIVAYGMIFGGHHLYKEVITKGGDILNGQILMVLGVLILIAIFVNNVRRTSFVLGSVLSTIQAVIYMPLATLGLIFFIAAFAYLSDTKPVYTINK